jgi:hypothetical protein
MVARRGAAGFGVRRQHSEVLYRVTGRCVATLACNRPVSDLKFDTADSVLLHTNSGTFRLEALYRICNTSNFAFNSRFSLYTTVKALALALTSTMRPVSAPAMT